MQFNIAMLSHFAHTISSVMTDDDSGPSRRFHQTTNCGTSALE